MPQWLAVSNSLKDGFGCSFALAPKNENNRHRRPIHNNFVAVRKSSSVYTGRKLRDSSSEHRFQVAVSH
jgi:hypothetical protein